MNRIRVVDKPLSFRPTTDQRKRIEHIASLLGSPGNLATAIRWALENTPMPAKQVEVKNAREK